MRLHRIFLVVLSSLFWACGGGLYLNENYHFDGNQNFRLALVPLSQKVLLYDTLMVAAFEHEMPSRQTLMTPFEIRSRIENDNELVALLNKIILQDHTKKQMKGSPNLRDLMAEADFGMLQERLDMADLLMVPILFGVGSLLNYTTGEMKVRLYDLKSGALLYEKSEDLNVNMGGEGGKLYMARLLIGIMAASYQENLLLKSSIE